MVGHLRVVLSDPAQSKRSLILTRDTVLRATAEDPGRTVPGRAPELAQAGSPALHRSSLRIVVVGAWDHADHRTNTKPIARTQQFDRPPRVPLGPLDFLKSPYPGGAQSDFLIAGDALGLRRPTYQPGSS